MITKSGNKIVYIYSDELLFWSNKNPAVAGRAPMVHELIKSYGLLKFMEISPPKVCIRSDLRNFHSEEYLGYIQNIKESDEDQDQDSALDFGLGFDCPIFPGLFKYSLMIAGSTIKAAEEILNGERIVFNWFGGWHHAEGSKAAGYCYVNDIVLGILTLRQKFQRILYIDLDVHHGDGVENAFESTKRVFTLSFHQHEPGFYPGTGTAEDCGFVTAKGYSANFPYKSGLAGELFQEYFKRITSQIFERYQPQVCVIQCGGDIIVGDHQGGTNIIPGDIITCMQMIFTWNIPLMILGGGGYNYPNTSRYWTLLTSLACNKELNVDIPEDNEHFLSYGPDFVVNISRKRLVDMNSKEYLEKVAETIENNFDKYDLSAI